MSVDLIEPTKQPKMLGHVGSDYQETGDIMFYLVLLPSLLVAMGIAISALKRTICMSSESVDQKHTDVENESRRKMPVAPILTKVPANFTFSNNVKLYDSESSLWPESALSLDKAVGIGRLLVPCARCATIMTRGRVETEVDLAIPGEERPGTTTKQVMATSKMRDVETWLANQRQFDTVQGGGGDESCNQALARGIPLLFANPGTISTTGSNQQAPSSVRGPPIRLSGSSRQNIVELLA